MADKIKKVLAKLRPKEREVVKLLLLRTKLSDLAGLDIKALKGHKGVYRVRRGNIRITFTRHQNKLRILRIDRRNEGAYKDL